MGENEKDNNKSKPHPVDNSILVSRYGVNIWPLDTMTLVLRQTRVSFVFCLLEPKANSHVRHTIVQIHKT